MLAALPYFIAWRLIRLLPEKTSYSLFYRIGEYVTKKNGRSIQRLRSNLSRVCPKLSTTELDALVNQSMRSYMRYWCDTFRSPDWSISRTQETVTTTNEHLIMDAINAGTGVVVALPHSGNWDHAGSYYTSRGGKVVTVAERLKPEALFDKFVKYRAALGLEVLPLDSRSVVTLLARAKSGGVVALVADRDLSHSGIEVDFFGARAKMPAGPVLVALRAGVPLITASVTYTDKGIHIYFRRIEIPEAATEQERISLGVQAVAESFEMGISSHPQDWHMLQKIWIDS